MLISCNTENTKNYNTTPINEEKAKETQTKAPSYIDVTGAEYENNTEAQKVETNTEQTPSKEIDKVKEKLVEYLKSKEGLFDYLKSKEYLIDHTDRNIESFINGLIEFVGEKTILEKFNDNTLFKIIDGIIYLSNDDVYYLSDTQTKCYFEIASKISFDDVMNKSELTKAAGDLEKDIGINCKDYEDFINNKDFYTKKVAEFFNEKIEDMKKRGLKPQLIKKDFLTLYLSYAKHATCEELEMITGALKYLDEDFQKIVLELTMSSCENEEQQRSIAETASKDSQYVSKEVINYIVSLYDEGKLLNIPQEDKNRFQQIKQKLNNNEELSEEDTQFLEKYEKECEQIKNIGGNIVKGVAQRDDYERNEQHDIYSKVDKGIAACDEETYEEYIKEISNWYEENKEDLGLSDDFYTYMNEITHGNFERAINGEELDFSYLEAGTNSQESAYNSETGLLETNPNTDYAAMQANIQNNQNLIKASEDKEQTPELVKDGKTAGSAASVIAGTPSGNGFFNRITTANFNEYKESCSSDDAAAAGILTGEVDTGNELVNWAIGKYKNMGKNTQVNTLANSVGKYIYRLCEKSKYGTLLAFIYGGKKAGCFNDTETIKEYEKEYIEENITWGTKAV